MRRQFELHGRAHGRALREHTLRAAPFRELREFQQVQELVRRLARRLARSHQRRQKKARRGALDARRTLASSLRYNAVPVELHWRQRRRLKAKVLVVCDVSSSVRDAARFLLQFLYAMTDVLPRVRSFAFAARFDEVTEDFDRYAPEVAVGRILDRVSGSGTDYGTMFQELEARCRGEIDRQTTVIILGDARNNDLPAGERHLADIARRARQVFWLNPEPPSRWNSGDAIMARYQPYCRAAPLRVAQRPEPVHRRAAAPARLAAVGDAVQGGAERLVKARQVHRLGDVADHAGIVAGGDLLRHRVGGERDHRNHRQAPLPLQALDRPGGLEAIHIRHLAIHQHQIKTVRPRQQGGQGLGAALRRFALMAELAAQPFRHQQVDVIVVDDQQSGAGPLRHGGGRGILLAGLAGRQWKPEPEQ